MFGALRERDFRLLFTGQTISLIGSSITTIALAFAVLEISNSNIDLGIVMAAGLVPVVALLLVGGVWADRLPRQWVMLVSDVVRFACQAVMAWLLVTHKATIWELVVLQFVRGSAEAFFRPAQTGLVPQTVSADRLQQANALRGLTESLGVTLGAALGGVLVAVVGSGWAIGLDSLSYLASAGFLWELRGLVPRGSTVSGSLSAAEAGLTAGLTDGRVALPDGELGLQAGSFLHDLRDGWQEFRSRTWLWVMVCEAAVFHLVIIAPLMVLGPSVARHSLGGAAAWGAILASLGVGQLIGGAAGLRLRPVRPLLLCGWLTLLEVPLFALFAFGYGTSALIGAAALCGISAALINVLWETTLQEQIPAEALSRVSAFDLMGSLAFYPLGIAVAGPVAAVIGIAGSFTVAGVATVASALLQILLPDIRRLHCGRPASGGGQPPQRDGSAGAGRGADRPPVDGAASFSAARSQTGLPVSSHSRYRPE
jgi:predicted MFS family arabinose efflux permease